MTDVVDLIMSDHREVERLFDVLKNAPETRSLNLPVLTGLLTAHSRAEEAEVYPAAAAVGGAEDVEHSQKEHLAADRLLATLAETAPEDLEFETRLQELADAISHHVEEEESTVLPGMRERMSRDQLRDLGDGFSAVRAELLGEQPGDVTRDQLLRQARNIDLEGRSTRSKAELEAELEERADL